MVAAGARAVPGTAIKRDPLRLRIGHIELRAVATRIKRNCAGIESNSVQRVGNGAHGTIELAGRKRVLEFWIRGHLDTQALLGGFDERRLLSFVATRMSGLPRAVGLVVGTPRGNDLAHAHAALGLDRLCIGRGRAVLGARVATIGRATTTRWRRTGRAQQHEDDESVQQRHWCYQALIMQRFGCPWYVGALATPSGIDSTCIPSSRPSFCLDVEFLVPYRPLSAGGGIAGQVD